MRAGGSDEPPSTFSPVSQYLFPSLLTVFPPVLNAGEALSGFSSTTMAVVGVMFVVVAGLTYTGILHWIVKHLLGWPKGHKTALLRLMVPVAVLSPLLNTVTVVAMFVPVVKMWSKKLKISPSRLLIPACLAGNMGAAAITGIAGVLYLIAQ